MGLFRAQRPDLMKRSPLLLSVPIGGTDTVLGLRPMAYGQDSGVTRDEARIAKKVTSSPPPQHARSFYKRYKGPYLETLTRDSWKHPPKSWRHFFYGQTSEFVYNVPENSEHLQERMEENLIRYLVRHLDKHAENLGQSSRHVADTFCMLQNNYIWLAASFLMCFL